MYIVSSCVRVFVCSWGGIGLGLLNVYMHMCLTLIRDLSWCLEERGMVGVYSEFVRRHRLVSMCSLCTFMFVYTLMWWYSLLHLQCHFFILNSQSMISISRSLLPRFVEKRPRRLRLEIKIEWHCKCNRLYGLLHLQCQSISISNLSLESQSCRSLFNETRQKRPRERHQRFRFENEEMTLKMQCVLRWNVMYTYTCWIANVRAQLHRQITYACARAHLHARTHTHLHVHICVFVDGLVGK